VGLCVYRVASLTLRHLICRRIKINRFIAWQALFNSYLSQFLPLLVWERIFMSIPIVILKPSIRYNKNPYKKDTNFALIEEYR